METKKCKKCNIERPVEMFSKNKNTKDGLECWCKLCKKQQYIDDRLRRLEYQKQYTEKNKEKLKETQKKYREKTKAKASEYNKKYQEKNRERLLKYEKEYREKNKEKISQKRREYESERRKKDELYVFKKQVRNLIYWSFRRKKVIKECKSTDILGCDFDELRKHLLKTFFENYGYEYDGLEDVHIDHIVPLATAETKNDVKRLCHYTNLQLLKASDNLKKWAKM